MLKRRCILLPVLLPAALAFGQASGDAAATDRAALEAAFAEKLNNVVLIGTFSILTPDGMTEGKTERYTIKSARKIKDDVWLFEARVQYAERDVTVPMPLNVQWAGDTPVITLENTAIPGLGTYSARVLFYRDLYSGTWVAPGHYGVMSGRIVKADDPAAADPAATTQPAGGDDAPGAE